MFIIQHSNQFFYSCTVSINPNEEHSYMSNLETLLQEKAAIESRIKQAKKEKKAEAVAQCRRLIDDYDITEKDLFKGKRAKRSSAKVAPKYRNPHTGETWTGRGKPPKWIANQNRDNFLIR